MARRSKLQAAGLSSKRTPTKRKVASIPDPRKVASSVRTPATKRREPVWEPLRASVRTLPVAVVMRDRKGRVAIWNGAASQLFGFRESEVLGKPFPLGARGRRATNEEPQVRNEQVARRKNGEPLFVDSWCGPLHGENGEIVGTLEIVVDATVRVQAKGALKEKTALLSLLERVAVAANESATLEGALQRTLDEICSHTGWPVGHAYLAQHRGAQVLFPTPIWHLSAPKKRFATFRRVTESTPMAQGVGLPGRVLANGRPAWIMDVTEDPNFPRARAAKDIGVRAGFAFPIRVEKEVVGVLEFYSPHAKAPDETLLESMSHIGTQLGRVVERTWAERERAALLSREKAARTEAQEAEQRVAFLFEATSALMAQSPELDQTLEAIAKLTMPQFADWCALDLVDDPPDRGAGVVHTDAGKTDLARRLYGHLHAASQNGPIEPLLAQGRPVRIQSLAELGWAKTSDPAKLAHQLGVVSLILVPLVGRGRTLGSVCFVSSSRIYSKEDEALAADLGHRIALAIDNARLVQQAQRAVRARQDVLATVSHDLRTPVSSIVTTAELLMSERSSNRERSRVRAERIHRAALRLSSLLGMLLDAASIEAGRLHISPDVQSTTELVGEGIELMDPLAAAKSIQLRPDSSSASFHVRSDRERTVQVLSNLIGNAIKFTPEGGSVTVVVQDHGEGAQFSVKDGCGGIPAEQLPHLFDRFWRPQGSSGTGSGLGLFIAKGIIEAHEGKIWVESPPGAKGCVFHFTLPKAPT